jgi:hypothetical protein
MLHHMLSGNHGNTFYKLLMFYLEKRWKGCYGAQSVIRHTFLDTLVQKYSLIRLLDCIKTREQRMTFERILGLLCSYEQDIETTDFSVFGDIHDYTYHLTRNNKRYDYTYGEYLQDKENRAIETYPIVKVWTGR